MSSLSTILASTMYREQPQLWPNLQMDRPNLMQLIHSLFDQQISQFLDTLKKLAKEKSDIAWAFKKILQLNDQFLEILNTKDSSVKLLKMALIAFEINQMSPHDFLKSLYYGHESFYFLRKLDQLQSILSIDQLKTFMSQWPNKDIRLTMLHYYQLCEIGCASKEQEKLQLAYIITEKIDYNFSDVIRLYDLYRFDLDLRLRSESIIQRIKELNATNK